MNNFIHLQKLGQFANAQSLNDHIINQSIGGSGTSSEDLAKATLATKSLQEQAAHNNVATANAAATAAAAAAVTAQSRQQQQQAQQQPGPLMVSSASSIGSAIAHEESQQPQIELNLEKKLSKNAKKKIAKKAKVEMEAILNVLG